MTRWMFAAVVAAAPFVLCAHACAPHRSDPPPQLGPRLGESTAMGPSDPTVAPPDAAGPQVISAPFSQTPSGPPAATATPVTPPPTYVEGEGTKEAPASPAGPTTSTPTPTPQGQ